MRQRRREAGTAAQQAVGGAPRALGPAPGDFDTWVAAWGDRLTQFAYTYTANWASAQDVAQETFLRLYRQEQAGRPVHPGWLFAVARHLCIDAKRRAEPEPLSGGEADAGEEPALRRLLVRDLLDRLPPRDREVLWLFYYGGLSMAEVAGVVGIPARQVKTRLYRARQRFRALWEGDDE